MSPEISERIDKLEARIKDLEVKLNELASAIPVTKRKWSGEEERFLYKLAAMVSLKKDDLRVKSTKYYRVIQSHQSKYERTERAVMMKLERGYFK